GFHFDCGGSHELGFSHNATLERLAGVRGSRFLAQRVLRSYRGDLEIVCGHCGKIQAGTPRRRPVCIFPSFSRGRAWPKTSAPPQLTTSAPPTPPSSLWALAYSRPPPHRPPSPAP